MFSSKFRIALTSCAILLSPVMAQPSLAQAAAAQAKLTAGAKVSDTSGGEVGSVIRVDGDHAIVKTDKHEVRLPATSFTAHQGGFIIAMTRDQLNAAVEETLAKAAEKIVAGAAVADPQGGSVGTIEAVDGETVTLKLTTGKLIRLPRAGVAPGPNGAVVGMTAAQLEAAAAGAAEPKSN